MAAPGIQQHARDQDLAAAVLNGSKAAWHRFVHEYGDLIFHQINRYLAYGTEDDRREVFVDTLAALRSSALRTYKGRAKLSTWLVYVVRNRCIDYLRRHRGRKATPPWLQELTPGHRLVYYWYFIEGEGLTAVFERLSAQDRALELCDVAQWILDIESRLDPGTQRRLAFDLQSRSLTGISGRLLEYIQTARLEAENKAECESLTQKLMIQVRTKLLRRIARSLETLPVKEQEVIRARILEGKTAKQTAADLRLASARRVYSLEARALRTIRKCVGED